MKFYKKRTLIYRVIVGQTKIIYREKVKGTSSQVFPCIAYEIRETYGTGLFDIDAYP